MGRALHAVKEYSRALAALNDYIALKPESPAGWFFAGRTCLVLGFYHKAVSFLRCALNRSENKSPPAHGRSSFSGVCLSLLGVAYLKSRHSRAAVDTLEKAVGADPENKRIYRAYLNALFIRGIRVCRNEEFELGEQMLRFVLENSEKAGFRAGPILHLEMGRAYRELDRLDEALKHYGKALEFSPNDPMIRWYRASILTELGDDEEALKDIAALRSLGMDIPDLPWNGELVDRYMILSFMKTGSWRRAADACKDWIKKRGSSPAVHAMYAEAWRNMRAYQTAENHLNRALELDEARLELWYSLALCAWEGRHLSALKKALYRAKKLGGDSNILSRFSILYESETSKNPQQTLTLLQKAVRSLGPDPELMYALGKCYLCVGMPDEAAGWFSKTVFLRDNHEEAWLGLVAARETLFGDGVPGSREDLEKSYGEYLKRWPDNLALRRDEALFLVKTSKYEKAAEKLEALLAWDPANPALRRVLAFSYRKAGRHRDAALFLKALLRENPEDIRVLLEYCGCMEQTGEAKYARAILEKAVNHFKDSSELPTALALLAWKDGRMEQAFDMLRNAVSRNKNDPRPWRWMAVIAKSKGDKEAAVRYRREFERLAGKKRET